VFFLFGEKRWIPSFEPKKKKTLVIDFRSGEVESKKNKRGGGERPPCKKHDGRMGDRASKKKKRKNNNTLGRANGPGGG